MDGIWIIDKPEGFTSFDVVAKLRGITGVRKIGHAGTLDPMATGVLPVFLGKATRAISLLQNHDKEYRAGFQLGICTDTLDRTGTVLSESASHITKTEVEEALSGFRGTTSQIPPMFSAVKVNGKRLYTLARKGESVERKERMVTIFELKLLDFNELKQQGELLIHCSQGTYVRSLCSDLGERLGTGAILTSLVRTKACGFSLDQCVTFEQVQNREAALYPIASLFRDLPRVWLNEAQAKMFSHGRQLSAKRIKGVPGQGICTVYYQDAFLGVARRQDGQLKIEKNFS